MPHTDKHILTIAYDAKRAYLNYRGLGNYSRTLLSQMAQYYGENRYLLCTPQDSNLYPWLNQSPYERILPHGLWRLSPSIWRRFGIPASLHTKPIDIYHGLSQELPEGIERLGCRTVVTMHDAIFMRYPDLYSPTYRFSFIRRNVSACRRADLCIAISEQTKRDYMDFFGVESQHIRVVYQGCNDIFWHPISLEQQQKARLSYGLPSSYVLCVGALEERKNQLRLIKALASASVDMPLVLVGKGSPQYVQVLVRAAKRYGVPLLIISNARVEDMPSIYRCSSIFAYPSLFEGFGIPILEAARCAVPIVASTGTCFEEIAGEGALYASPTHPDAIGEAIRTTLQDTDATYSRIKLALSNTEKFRANRIAQAMMNTYQSLI